MNDVVEVMIYLVFIDEMLCEIFSYVELCIKEVLILILREL